MDASGGYIGPYRVLRRIGSGGMGEVFAAIHERLDQQVALKLLSREAAQDPQIVARFIQEGRALAKLQHPGIIRVLACDTADDGTTYLAMELLEGIPLRDWIREKNDEPSLEAALTIVHQIADAMIEVHRQGIVHRDLKPENVFLVRDATTRLGYRIKVLDFGIAKVPPTTRSEPIDTQVLTATPVMLGTATYMAPEQCRDAAAVTDRTDVYALGAMLFELIAGRPPFVADDAIEMVSKHLQEVPSAVRQLVPGTPPLLNSLIASMLAKAPETRPTMLRCREAFGQPWSHEPEECPFPGLQPFSIEHAELFFARDEEIAEVISLLKRSGDESRWVQIEGPSGVGKSSLVQAGILPRLRGETSQTHPWKIINLRPSDDPIRALANALLIRDDSNTAVQDVEEVERTLHGGDTSALSELLMEWTPPDHTVLLVLEQLEELLVVGDASNRQLDGLLASALEAPGSPLRLLTTLRSDFLHRIDQLPRLAGLLDRAARYHLRTMAQTALEQIVEGMAQRTGLQLAEGLPERIGKDAAEVDSPLPLLGHMLRDLWSSSRAPILTHQRYEELGGVGGALAQHAERLLDELGPEGCERAKWMLLSLVQIGRGVPDTRRPRTRQQVLEAAGRDAQAENVLLRLAGEQPSRRTAGTAPPLRVLVLAGEQGPASEQQRVDLVHETLLRKVPRFAAWLEAERPLLERHADLEVAAHTWEQASSPAEGLPSGSLLAHYRGRAWASQQQEMLLRMASLQARLFLRAAQRSERRRGWRNRLIAFGAAAAIIAIVVAAVLAWRGQRRARENLQLFITATDSVVSDTDWEMARYPHMSGLRRKALQQIEASFLDLKEDSNAFEVSKALIKTRHRLSDLERESGSLREAEQTLVEALQEIEGALERWPRNESMSWLLPLNHSKRGKVALAQGRFEDARAHFTRSIRLLEKLVAGDDSRDARRTLAISYAEQAELELEVGQIQEACRFYDLALPLLEENDAASSGSAGSGAASSEDRSYERSLLAQVLSQRARAARMAGKLGEADRLLARGIELETPVVHANRGNAMYRSILASLQLERAALRTQQGRLDEALDEHQAVQGLGEELCSGDPTNKIYALLLSHGLAGAEELLRARGEPGAAEQLRLQRCELVARFLEQDDSDQRFQRLGCR